MNKEFVKIATMKLAADYNLGQAVLTAGAIISVSALVDEIIDYLRASYHKYKSREYYTRMLEAHPQLQKEDPIEVAKYWESLNHFAPSMAADPLAAGAYITQSIRRLSGEQLGGPPPDTFDTLTSIQKQYSEYSTKKPKSGIGVMASGAALNSLVGGIMPKEDKHK